MLVKKIWNTAVIVFVIVVCISKTSLAVPGDFDADGTSDLSVALVDRTRNTTAWATRLTNGATPLFWTFFRAADALASMRFHTGDPRYYPAIIRVSSASQPLDWYIKNAAGNEVTFKYGLPGDIIPNQGDFDCDGREDPTVVRNQGGVLHWYIARTASNTMLHTTFGVNGDQVGISDTKGDCTADLVVLRNNFFWYVRDPASLDFSTTQWGFNNDIPLLPGDYDGDGLADFAISRKSGVTNGGQTGFVKLGNGQAFTRLLGFDSSIPQIGKFTSGPSDFAWSQRDTGWVAIRNPNGSATGVRLGIPSNIIIRADGTVVQPTSTATFPAAATPTEPPPSGGIASCSVTHSSGWLLKPRSQDTGDDRQGKPMILYTRNLPSSACLNVLASNGSIIGKYGRFVANRYYSGRSGLDRGCGSSIGPEELAARALAASGSKNITIQDPATNVCWGSGPADGRTDRR